MGRTRVVRIVVSLALVAACGGDDGGDDGGVEETCVVPAGDGPAAPASGAMCRLLSTYRLFDDVRAQAPAPGVEPFDLNTPLFSDYTDKFRFLHVPAGAAMQWHAVDSLDMPVGTMMAKTFAYAVDRRDPGAGRDLLETRILVRMTDGWKAAAYVYGEDDTEAELAIAGELIDTSWIHDDGTTKTNRYAVPNVNQCGNCHEEHDEVLGPLGPKARHWNRVQPGGTENQLARFTALGWIAGTPPMGEWPRTPVWNDVGSGTLDERARGWLDINCSHCHNPRGAARTSGLDLTVAQTDPAMFGVCKPPVAAGQGSGGRQFGIVPGQPDASIFMFRLESTEPDVKMPELGRNLVHAEGVALVREWITAMPGDCSP
jgi:uncharacterized repeat protein (TIGR03806 family)